jgi:hypothetical protein
MNLSITATVIYLIMGASLAFGQASGGGGGGSGGSSAGGGSAASAPTSGARAPSTAAPPMSGPGSPAPDVANTPTDPGRNNVDVNPPTRQLQGQSPATARPPTAGSASQRALPGSATSQPPQGKAGGLPGAAKSPNSDGYSECMSMWNSSDTGESRDEWSKTCDRTRLPPK